MAGVVDQFRNLNTRDPGSWPPLPKLLLLVAILADTLGLPTAALLDKYVKNRPVFLRRYDGHMAVVNTPLDEPELRTVPLFDEDRLLVAPTNHPLADRDSITLAELSEYELLLEAQGTLGIHHAEVFIGVFIGAVTFTGSIVAFLKLSGRINSAPLMLPGKNILNVGALVVFLGLSALGIAALMGFRGLRLDFLQKPHAQEHSSVVLSGGAR